MFENYRTMPVSKVLMLLDGDLYPKVAQKGCGLFTIEYKLYKYLQVVKTFLLETIISLLSSDGEANVNFTFQSNQSFSLAT